MAVAIVLLATACKGADAASSASASGPVSASAAAPSTPPASPAVPAVSPSPSGSVVPSASATASATATTQSCQSWAASHTFAEVYDSTFHKDGSLGLYLHPATVSCGGPDDLHYDISAKTVTATVVPSGTVQMLVTTPAGPADRPLSRKVDLDVLLGQDHWGRIFMVTGPLTAITALKEMYHP